MLTRIRRNLRTRNEARTSRPRALRASEVSSAAVNSWSLVAGHGGSTGHGSPSRLLG